MRLLNITVEIRLKYYDIMILCIIIFIYKSAHSVLMYDDGGGGYNWLYIVSKRSYWLGCTLKYRVYVVPSSLAYA